MGTFPGQESNLLTGFGKYKQYFLCKVKSSYVLKFSTREDDVKWLNKSRKHDGI